jgi:hypothetical protein
MNARGRDLPSAKRRRYVGHKARKQKRPRRKGSWDGSWVVLPRGGLLNCAATLAFVAGTGRCQLWQQAARQKSNAIDERTLFANEGRKPSEGPVITAR